LDDIQDKLRETYNYQKYNVNFRGTTRSTNSNQVAMEEL
jgi:hypothetical protein